jgi:TPR repeat protein
MAEALKWMQLAADGGNANACFVLSLYSSENTQLFWAYKAADYGHISAQFYLYRDLNGDEKTRKESHIWLRKSAEGGLMQAQKVLGLNHMQGSNGFFQNLKEAEIWLRHAANQGDCDSTFNLVSCLKSSVGIQNPRFIMPKLGVETIPRQLSQHLG